mmetsp:Transcript_12635/g.40690  ORF Transcript_12635/g.40690 Transcript_12635/m.40690 type:complete len:297 (-) Transcript_12635:153-1043(-)
MERNASSYLRGHNVQRQARSLAPPPPPARARRVPSGAALASLTAHNRGGPDGPPHRQPLAGISSGTFMRRETGASLEGSSPAPLGRLGSAPASINASAMSHRLKMHARCSGRLPCRSAWLGSALAASSCVQSMASPSLMASRIASLGSVGSNASNLAIPPPHSTYPSVSVRGVKVTAADPAAAPPLAPTAAEGEGAPPSVAVMAARRGSGLFFSPRKVRRGWGKPSGGNAETVLRMYSCNLCRRSRLVVSVAWPNPYVLDTGNAVASARAVCSFWNSEKRWCVTASEQPSRRVTTL